ncbi:MAG: aminotransferase class IV, partial [Pseudomonadota bacterium]
SEMMGVSAQDNSIHLAVAVWNWGAYYGEARTKGARLDLAKWRRPAPDTIPCKAKAAGLYMICTLSKHEAERKGYSDALMLDYRGYVAEATGANVFFVKDGKVHTPTPDCFLDGITRQTVIGLLKRNGVELIERHIEPEEMEEFEQCFLTGTAAEVTPVSEIGPYRFDVGALTRDLAGEYDALVRAGAA